MTSLEKFESKYCPDPNSGCWLWLLPALKFEYGSFYDREKGKCVLAHRWSYEYYKGEIPPGLVIDHKCRNKACVNPNHLRVVTIATNTLENSTSASALNKQKTHCYKGHPLSGDNLISRIAEKGKRRCRTCTNERQKRYYWTKASPVTDGGKK